MLRILKILSRRLGVLELSHRLIHVSITMRLQTLSSAVVNWSGGGSKVSVLRNIVWLIVWVGSIHRRGHGLGLSCLGHAYRHAGSKVHCQCILMICIVLAAWTPSRCHQGVAAGEAINGFFALNTYSFPLKRSGTCLDCSNCLLRAKVFNESEGIDSIDCWLLAPLWPSAAFNHSNLRFTDDFRTISMCTMQPKAWNISCNCSSVTCAGKLPTKMEHKSTACLILSCGEAKRLGLRRCTGDIGI